MEEKDSILGCFVSHTMPSYDMGAEANNIFEKESTLFRSYIWGEKGIDNHFKKLKYSEYGNDIALILFQFYVKPLPIELPHLQKQIGTYRQSEKSIGVNVIITDDNFFNKGESERYEFLYQSIFESLNLIGERVKKKKLDTNVAKLKYDLQNIL